MKALRYILPLLIVGLTMIQQTAMAQCAQCAAVVESSVESGDKAAAGINNGIMYLLVMPYLAVAIVGFVWYKKYRRKDVTLQMRDEKLHLN